LTGLAGGFYGIFAILSPVLASIRKTRTASGATAVQLVRYTHDRIEVLKHIGSAHDQAGIDDLVRKAQRWYTENPGEDSLFAAHGSAGPLIPEGTEFLGATHGLAYSTLCKVVEDCGLRALEDGLLLDLAIIRLVEPTSKLRSLALLEQYFGIQHARSGLYRRMASMLGRKEQVERIAISYATSTLKDGLTWVLYDVTTLYFESFTADELRVPGFSKDNMHQQPQVVVGLLVTPEGFPLGYEVFPGNTFEGKTMLPILDAFTTKHKVATSTIVADAAMLSGALLEQIAARNMTYIVAARLATASEELVDQVCKRLVRKDGRTVRVQSPHGDMVCAFSSKRYKKDKAMHEKDLAKAKALVAKGQPGKRAKFVKGGKQGYTLDDQRIARTQRLLGIKGYCTNIPKEELDNKTVIARYHDLWHVEKAFRMAKSDLATRPIFHFEQTAIRTHLLICFIALIIARTIEKRTGGSIRAAIDELWKVTDATLYHPASSRRITLRSTIPDQTAKILRKLNMPY
jgi:transposase